MGNAMLKAQVKAFMENKLRRLDGEMNDAVIKELVTKLFAYKEMAEVLLDTRITIDNNRIFFED